MHALLMTLLVIVALIIDRCRIIAIGKSAGLSGAISGGAEQLFGKQKARGLDLVLQRVTIVLCRFIFCIGNSSL